MSQISIVPSGNQDDDGDDREDLTPPPLTFKEQLQRFENISRLNVNHEKQRSLARNQTLRSNLKKLSLDSRQILLNDMLQKRQTSLSTQHQRAAFRSIVIERPFAEQLAPPIERLVESINHFSFSLYSHACSNVNRNVVFSSLPFYFLLNTFHSANNGKIREDIQKSLGLVNGDADALSGSNFEDLKSLLMQNFSENSTNFSPDHLRTRTNVYSRNDYLREQDIEMLRESFKASLTEETSQLLECFGDLRRLAGVENQPDTENNLSHLFMILTSSLDLKLEWKRPFEDMKDKGTFEKPDGQAITINLMNIPKHRFLYCKNPCNLPAKLCEFPFANEDFVFTIVLPERHTIERVERELTADLFEKCTAQMKYVEVNSVLPKFLIEDRFDLVKFLDSVGIGSLTNFENKDYGLCVSEAFYRSSIDVRNTAVLVSAEASSVLSRDETLNVDGVEHPCEEFVCDNPFLFFIRNKYTKLILFVGKLTVPNVSN
jgi:serine protease inhibitor